MKRVFALLLLGAACSPQSETANDSAVSNAAASSDAPVADPAETNAAIPPSTEVNDAQPTGPEPAPIPAKFRGTWAETKANCADLKHPTRLTISGRTVRSPNYVLFGETYNFPAPNQFALEGKFEGSGQVGAAHYSINTAGDVLTDQAGGGMVRVRCA